ncbi:MAG: hypothetical protein ACR2LT_00245 [Pyrinomonadaceae bacterium]
MILLACLAIFADQITLKNGDRFNNRPVANAKKNDFLFSSGLWATFERKKNK